MKLCNMVKRNNWRDTLWGPIPVLFYTQKLTEQFCDLQLFSLNSLNSSCLLLDFSKFGDSEFQITQVSLHWKHKDIYFTQCLMFCVACHFLFMYKAASFNVAGANSICATLWTHIMSIPIIFLEGTLIWSQGSFKLKYFSEKLIS